MEIPQTMQAMVLHEAKHKLRYSSVPVPPCGRQQVLLKVLACGICRTDLHFIDGELSAPKLPLIPGHEVIGKVVEIGSDVSEMSLGDIIGVPWLARTCGCCWYCLHGKENLCDNAAFTGYTVDGGFAEYMVADASYCLHLKHKHLQTAKAAPLLCAGLIGYRAYSMAGDVANIGIYGFGAAAHIIAQVAQYQGKRVFAFTQKNDEQAQRFALSLGASWAGDSTQAPPEALDAAIIFAPVGELIPAALKATRKAATVVCGGIHMSDIPSFPYELLWGERIVRSIANLTRKDGLDFLQLAQQIPLQTNIEAYPLNAANEAIDKLRAGKISGAAVLVMNEHER